MEALKFAWQLVITYVDISFTTRSAILDSSYLIKDSELPQLRFGFIKFRIGLF